MIKRITALLSLCLITASCGDFDARWGLDPIDTMKTPVDPALSCPVAIPADTQRSLRASCKFGAGAHASQTLGIPASVGNAIPIRHVVIVMKENRSFDHLLGKLHDLGQPDTEAVPSTYFNPDQKGAAVYPFHATTTCYGPDPLHQSTSMVACMDNGAMDGFVKNAAVGAMGPGGTTTDGHFVMSYYTDAELPFNYWLAKTFALSDRHFAPMQSGTFGVRNFMMFGTNAGVVDTGISYPPPDTMSIFRALMNAGYTWGAYSDSEPFSGALGWSNSMPGVHTFKNFLDALDAGTLPNVSFVDAVESVSDDHPSDGTTASDLQVGEAWTKQIYDHAVKSPQWPRMAIIWTYDEAGGFADHVAPLPANACAATPSDSPFTALGPRIPLVAISPWARPHYVSHVQHDHTAITRFIETLFDLPALTGRDANSDALFDLFDFSSCAPKLMTPPPAPDVGTGGCVNPPAN
jgi:phospholipase C